MYKVDVNRYKMLNCKVQRKDGLTAVFLMNLGEHKRSLVSACTLDIVKYIESLSGVAKCTLKT